MTARAKDKLLDLLFDSDGEQLLNLKFLRGDAPDISAEELCEEAHSALLQVRTGKAVTSGDFEDDLQIGVVDVEKLTASL